MNATRSIPAQHEPHRDANAPQPASGRRSRRRRWPWALPVLCGLAGLAATVLSRRRRRRDELEQLAIRLAGQPSGRYRDEVATGRSPSGNGIVRTERPSASTD